MREKPETKDKHKSRQIIIMAKEKTKNPAEVNVEEKLKNLYALQTTLTQIDKVKTLRGELPREVQDLEDEIEGLTTRIEKIGKEMEVIKRDIAVMNENIEVNNANIARYKAQMDGVRNNREYDNLTKQIEYAELDNQLNEKRIGEAKALMESKTLELADSNALIYVRRTDLDNKKSELDEIVERSLRQAAIWDELKDRLNKSALGLSGGQQQRLCIARTLAVQPEVILMDEPTSALGPISTMKIEDLALELKKNYTIVIVTHNMQQAARISDKTAFFLLGELIEFNKTKQLFANPSNPKTEEYITGRFG